MMFVIVTQDRFFFTGMKQSLPESIQVDSWDEELNDRYLCDEHLALIVDNRIPLSNIYKIGEYVFSVRKYISVVVFEMDKGILYQRLTRAFGGYIAIDMLHSASRLNDMVNSNLSDSNAVSFFNICYLNINEREVIRMGMTSFNLSEQARALGCQEKTLYTRRNFLQKRLGFDSFIQTCNFVIRNNLL